MYGDDAVPISKFSRRIMGALLVRMIVAVPAVHYRQTYRYAKRLRTVTEGKVYRSGCNTADGLRAAIQKYGIKFVLNLQEEAPDPNLSNHYFTWHTTPESEVCRDMGVKFRFFAVELGTGKECRGQKHPIIDAFLNI